MDKNTIMIEVPLEEYKELLIIKGKYEELKLHSHCKCHDWTYPRFTWNTDGGCTIHTYGADGKEKAPELSPYTYSTISSTRTQKK